ncbi:Methyltransferase domain protein [Vibrio aerogenes CECT 7868]|uniref:Methyltransferase domain protein n=1 Tax=Vibrio aerogenes CECT 7868 TaxID=1216006 RepID=A0A1M5WW52_9VIBR|nr:methyltransferase domain-containing protein [Vibrio aerogenes]SHH91233.1 Methyltransferase domain protein [Vibrio aerogenes CECT 7868]
MITSNIRETAKAYDSYHGIGLYCTRYPQANARVLNTIFDVLSKMPKPCRVLDYGCGYGRYLYPILKQTQHHVYGYDISEVAISQALTNLNEFQERMSLFNHHETLDDALNHGDHNNSNHNKSDHNKSDHAGKIDAGLLLFGVLSHLKGKDERCRLLKWFYQHLHPDHGRLILSVPNRRRRFLYHQWQTKRHHPEIPAGDITYHRHQSGRKIPLYYHLYQCHELTSELEEAGFELEHLTAESFFPERTVLNSPLLSKLDHRLCECLPVSAGYGILAVARRRT